MSIHSRLSPRNVIAFLSRHFSFGLVGAIRSPLVLIFLFSCLPTYSQSLKAYFEDFSCSTLTPETLWEPAVSAGVSIGWSDYVSTTAGFGTGWEAYGHHYGVALADNVNGKFMRKVVFAAAFSHRDIYKPSTGGGIWKGIGYAAWHTLFVSQPVSFRTFNWSGIPASFASAGLSNAYQPSQQQTWSATFTRFGTNSAGYMAGDIWTDIIGRLHDKHPTFHATLKNR